MGYKKDKASGKLILKKKDDVTVLESTVPSRKRVITIEQRQVVRGLELAQGRLTKATSELIAAQEAFDDAQQLFTDWEILNA